MPEEPTEDQLRNWHRWFAMEANNRAWTLCEKSDLTSEECAELLDAAHAAAHHWQKIGTEAQVAQARLLLGRVHALLGHGSLAMKFATAAFDSITSRDCATWETAFAHAILAHAAATSGDTRVHAKRYAEAEALGEKLESEEKDLFLATFTLVPQPRTSAEAGHTKPS